MTRALLLFAISLILRGQAPCTPSAELKRLVDADQKDREPDSIDWQTVGPRDAERRTRVKEIVNSGVPLCAEDLSSAALVLQHGDKPDDFLLAHVLASAAVVNGDKDARWLSAAALDRYLQSMEKAQIFGTQYRKKDSGPWNQDPFDTKLVPPQVREIFKVPALDKQQRQLKEMNR